MGFESAGSRAWLLEAPWGRTCCAGTQTPTALLPCQWLTGSREGFPGLHSVTSPVTAAIIKTLFKNSPYARWVGLFPPRNYPNTAAQPAQLHMKHGWLQCHIGSEMPPRSGCWHGAVPLCAHVPVPPHGSSAAQTPRTGLEESSGGCPQKAAWCTRLQPLVLLHHWFSPFVLIFLIVRHHLGDGNLQVWKQAGGNASFSSRTPQLMEGAAMGCAGSEGHPPGPGLMPTHGCCSLRQSGGWEQPASGSDTRGLRISCWPGDPWAWGVFLYHLSALLSP